AAHTARSRQPVLHTRHGRSRRYLVIKTADTHSLHSFPTGPSSDLERGDGPGVGEEAGDRLRRGVGAGQDHLEGAGAIEPGLSGRSEEHTSGLQSLTNLVCRLLLEKKKLRIQRGEP